jgi:hypothetical protein
MVVPLKSFLSPGDGLFDRMRESSATGSRYPHLPPVTIAPISALAIGVLFLKIPCHSLFPPLVIGKKRLGFGLEKRAASTT